MDQAVKQPKHVALPGGHHIHLRREQMILWSVIAGFLGAGFIAGLYFGILEVNWHLFWLKPWWDGLFKQAWWPTYRHTAFRDIPEPAFATMGVMTLIAKQKYWDKPVGNIRLAATPLLVIVLTFALGVAGTWLLNYGLPAAARSDLAWHSAGDLILGFAIGRVMHVLWAPVGATIQGRLLEGSADKASARHHVPAWVRYPLAPPVMRERFAHLYAKSRQVTGNAFTSSTWRRYLIAVMVLVFIVVTVIGLLGHYYAGTGHSIVFLPTTK